MEQLFDNIYIACFIAFFTQLLYIYSKVINILHTVKNNKIKAVISNIMNSLASLFGIAVGIKSILTGSWIVIVFFVLGSVTGQLIGMIKKKTNG